MSEKKPRVLAAMSGGVDSSVAAALLLEQGYEVVGVTLRLWDCDEEGPEKACCGVDQVGSAKAVAQQIGIPHYVVDSREPFQNEVLEQAWLEYDRGRTPNPCVLCNERLKFGVLLDKARSLGATQVATGHYARIQPSGEGERLALYRGVDHAKDQSYFLFALNQRQLKGALFPLGGFTKEEVRDLARERSLPSAERAESQDACLMVEDGGFAEALRLRFQGEARPGTVVDESGKVLAEHEGIHRFTIGQRRGLGMAMGKPAYVQRICHEQGKIVVGVEPEGLMARGLIAGRINWIAPLNADQTRSCQVQIRYRHRAEPARITVTADGRAEVVFETPIRAVTPGQAAVFYRGEEVLGGGWIDEALKVE